MSLKSKLRALLPSIPRNEDELAQTATNAALASYELDRLTAERDTAAEEITRRFSDPIARTKKQFESLVDSLRLWSRANRATFGARKTYLVNGHALTFRQSPGKLENPAKDDALIDAIIASEDDALIDAAITIKPALDKNGIKSALESNPELAPKLAALGFTISREETFEFKPATREA